MIEKILELLSLDNYYGKSELIEFAKGKYKIPTTIKEAYKQNKRVKNGN
tara:strand:- start:391 stop:537 length:147 start_codon:yes stop_codon:yes gene_type:complete